MKKLNKALAKNKNTIEAFACNCKCGCSCLDDYRMRTTRDRKTSYDTNTPSVRMWG